MSQKAETQPINAPKAEAETAKPADELSQGELDQVAGGKVKPHDFTFTKLIDKSSPVL